MLSPPCKSGSSEHPLLQGLCIPVLLRGSLDHNMPVSSWKASSAAACSPRVVKTNPSREPCQPVDRCGPSPERFRGSYPPWLRSSLRKLFLRACIQLLVDRRMPTASSARVQASLASSLSPISHGGIMPFSALQLASFHHWLVACSTPSICALVS